MGMSTTRARPLLLAAAMCLIAAHMVCWGEGRALPILLDFETAIEFWHKYDPAGVKNMFGVVGEFGRGVVNDYALVDASDSEIGRSRGFGVSDSLEGYGLHELFTDTFTGGTYAGSSIIFSGHWNQSLNDNELAVIGGTGVFKYASGTAVFSFESRGSDVYFHVTGGIQLVSATR